MKEFKLDSAFNRVDLIKMLQRYDRQGWDVVSMCLRTHESSIFQREEFIILFSKDEPLYLEAVEDGLGALF